MHRIADVLDKLPKALQPRAKQALRAMLYAENRTACERELRRFTAEYGAKYPKAVAALTTDQERLLTLFDYPASTGSACGQRTQSSRRSQLPFGPDRCLFESNFPVDKMGIGWAALWNTFKRIVAGASASEKQAMFSGTARRVHRLD